MIIFYFYLEFALNLMLLSLFNVKLVIRWMYPVLQAYNVGSKDLKGAERERAR